MVYVLYIREEQASFRHYNSWMQKLSAMHGATQIIVDLTETFPIEHDPHNKYVFRSVADARFHPDLENLTWVWMIANEELTLSNFQHPKDNAVYAIGSDFDGFGDFDIPENDYKVALDETDEIYASICIHHVLYDRYMRV